MASAKNTTRKQAKPAERDPWRVVSASFEQSASGLRNAPPPGPPELAVAGRSNVGKSSLLNAFAGQRNLARVGRTPGRTQLLNFFSMRLRGAGQELALRWLDLPGYGYADAPRSVRESFGPMIEGYLSAREELAGMILLVDARRGSRDEDLELVDFMMALDLPVLIAVTKVDKISATERGQALRSVAEPLGLDVRDLVLTSAQTGYGLRAGVSGSSRQDLATQIARLLAPVQEVPILSQPDGDAVAEERPGAGASSDRDRHADVEHDAQASSSVEDASEEA